MLRLSTSLRPAARLAVSFEDTVPPSAETSYYVRVTQIDGQQAWSSPIWIRR